MPVIQEERKVATESPYQPGEAHRWLFEDISKFNHGHDVSDFNELVETKYPDATAATQQVTLDSASIYAEPVSHAPTFAELENYHVPQAQTQSAVSTAYDTATETQRYYTNDNPIPRTPFMPKIYDSNLREVTDNSAISDVGLEKVAEVTVAVDELRDRDTSIERAQAQAQAQAQTQDFDETEIQLKLNAKGLVAIVGFFAVVALVIALIIINGAAIGASNARIASLRAENAASATQLQRTIAERDLTYENAINEASKIQGAAGYEQISTIKKLPDLDTWEATTNPDASTNLFDRICAFLNRIF